MALSENTYKIFLSYPSSRESQVKYLAKFLEGKGFTTWYAPRDIPAGSTWYKEIPPAIESCDALVLIFCKKADKSENIGDEIRIARDKKKTRFYLRVEDKVFPKELDFLIGSSQWRDWFDENNEAPLNEIAALIRRKLNATVKQSSTENIFLSDSLAKRAEKFITAMNNNSALRQIRGGFTQQILMSGVKKPLVFLSCPDGKAESAKIIAEFLESRGFKSWYAQRDIQNGAAYYEEISAAIERCNAFVCVLCSESDKSEDCTDELVFAVDQGKPVFTVRTENFESEKRLSLYLGGSYIDWFNAMDIKPLEILAEVLSQKL